MTVQETVGAAGWPVLRAAAGLSQRSLLGLLDSRRAPTLPRPLAVQALVVDAVVDLRGRGVVRLRAPVAVKLWRATMTRPDARRCWSTPTQFLREKCARVAARRGGARCLLQVRTSPSLLRRARRVVLRGSCGARQLRTTRRASAARSASRRASSVSVWSTYCIAAAMARWPACSATRRCISCAMRR